MFGLPREKTILKTSSPLIRVEGLWRATSPGRGTGRAGIRSGKRVKVRNRLTAKGGMARRGKATGGWGMKEGVGFKRRIL